MNSMLAAVSAALLKEIADYVRVPPLLSPIAERHEKQNHAATEGLRRSPRSQVKRPAAPRKGGPSLRDTLLKRRCKPPDKGWAEAEKQLQEVRQFLSYPALLSPLRESSSESENEDESNTTIVGPVIQVLADAAETVSIAKTSATGGDVEIIVRKVKVKAKRKRKKSSECKVTSDVANNQNVVQEAVKEKEKVNEVTNEKEDVEKGEEEVVEEEEEAATEAAEDSPVTRAQTPTPTLSMPSFNLLMEPSKEVSTRATTVIERVEDCDPIDNIDSLLNGSQRKRGPKHNWYKPKAEHEAAPYSLTQMSCWRTFQMTSRGQISVPSPERLAPTPRQRGPKKRAAPKKQILSVAASKLLRIDYDVKNTIKAYKNEDKTSITGHQTKNRRPTKERKTGRTAKGKKGASCSSISSSQSSLSGYEGSQSSMSSGCSSISGFHSNRPYSRSLLPYPTLPPSHPRNMVTYPLTPSSCSSQRSLMSMPSPLSSQLTSSTSPILASAPGTPCSQRVEDGKRRRDPSKPRIISENTILRKFRRLMEKVKNGSSLDDTDEDIIDAKKFAGYLVYYKQRKSLGSSLKALVDKGHGTGPEDSHEKVLQWDSFFDRDVPTPPTPLHGVDVETPPSSPGGSVSQALEVLPEYEAYNTQLEQSLDIDSFLNEFDPNFMVSGDDNKVNDFNSLLSELMNDFPS